MATRTNPEWLAFFAKVNAAALARYPELLHQWFPASRVVGREFCCGNLNGDSGKSFKINIDTGLWSDFATGEPGGSDPISLYAALHSLKQGEAAKALADDFGIAPPHAKKKAPDSTGGAKQGKADDGWTPLAIVPDNAPDPEPLARYYAAQFKVAEYERYPYRNQAGALLLYVFRFDLPDGQKEVRPCAWCQNQNGTRMWRSKWPSAPLPLYRLGRLAERPELPILLLEGERKTDRADDLLEKDYVCVSIPSGAGAVSKTDFSTLAGRNVVFWPDHDQDGFGATLKGARALKGVAQSVKIVEPDPAWAEGHDIADLVAENWDEARLRRFIASHSVTPEKFQAFARERFPGMKGAGRGTQKGASHEGKNVQHVPEAAARISREHFFAQDAGGKLYHWRDGCYRPRGEELIRIRVRQIVPNEKWSSKFANETVEYIRVASPSLWERPPRNRLNLENGLLNLDTLALEAHSPDFLSPVQLPVRYDPEATCTEWESQITATFPQDAAKAGVAWEIVAWLMLPFTFIQKALLLIGPGGTGKSTVLTALSNFLGGRRNISSLSLQKLENDRFAAARLIGKLANICADLPTTHLESSSVFKSITGGDAIPAEYKFKDGFDFIPFARLIFSANHPPHSKDATDAFFQRWYVLPFVNVFRDTKREVKRDELDARLAEPHELSGVLNKALATLPAVLKGGLTVTESMRVAHLEFWRMTDPLSIWLLQNTIAAPGSIVAKCTLIEAYNSAAAREGRAGMTDSAFGLALRRLRLDLKEGQRTVGGKAKTWCYLGIGLRTSCYDGRQDHFA